VRLRRFVSEKNVNLMLLSHSNSVIAMPNRRHDRKEVRIPCTLTRVSVADVVNGRHTEHKFFPEKKKTDGMIRDISAGGCSIASFFGASEGDYVQIECILEREIEESIIARVVRTARETEGGEEMIHIRFIKMPRATMNRIFVYIYNYGERTK
jgi:PilZ domain.